MLFSILILIFQSLPGWSQSTLPSTDDCGYYQHLESQFHCGPKAYFQQAHPLCQKYLDAEPEMNAEIQEFFPKVRFCLQNELHLLGSRLTCEALDEVAVQSHVDCYVRTGYCDLSWASKSRLTLMTLPRMANSLWRRTAQEILLACQKISTE